MIKNLLYLTYGILLAGTASAQIAGERLYLPYNNPPAVKADGRDLPFAWCGGFNNPQISMADLNNDKIQDLVIYDPSGGGMVATFLNTSSSPGNPKYVYHPEFEANFPTYMSGFLKLIDYNRDKVPDLFYGGMGGVTPLAGYYDKDSKQLRFNFDTKFAGRKGLFYLTGGSGMVQVYVAPNDLPAVGDVDGDGDIDILSYEIAGFTTIFYRNCQVEDGLPVDSFPICVKDACWGKTRQNYERTLVLGYSCPFGGTIGTTCKGCDDPGSGAKTTHSGNTLTMVDMDKDGDVDIFNGNISFSDIQYINNGKKNLNYVRDSMISQDTLWSSNGKVMNMPQMPAAFWVDIDNDGDNDLTFAPFISNTENYKCISYYKNMGTTSVPNMVYQSDTLFMQDMIDVGTGSAPVLYDYNKDGKLDMFVGSEGLFKASNGTMKTVIFYYENTGTLTAPEYTLRDRDFLNLSTQATANGAALTIGDMDGDSKDDLIIGKRDGELVYYHNNAATQLMQPVWQNPLTLNATNGKVIDVGDFAAPFIYDLNKDGKKDLIIGCQNGRLFYYKNLGGAVAPTYVPYLGATSDTLGGITIIENNTFYTYLTPFIGKIDNSGKDYLLIGSKGGILYRYDFQGANATKFLLIDSGYSQINVKNHARPFIGDIDNDGRCDMVIGNDVGGVKIFKQYFNVGIDDTKLAKNGVEIYPNPAKNIINIGWQSTFATGKVHITLVSVTGQRLYDADVDGANGSAQIDVSSIANGTYYCLVRSDENQVSSPVSILR